MVVGAQCFTHKFYRVRATIRKYRLYAKAKAGQLKNFTGVDAPYEAPEKADVHLHTLGLSPEQLAEAVLSALTDRKIVAGEY